MLPGLTSVGAFGRGVCDCAAAMPATRIAVTEQGKRRVYLATRPVYLGNRRCEVLHPFRTAPRGEVAHVRTHAMDRDRNGLRGGRCALKVDHSRGGFRA